MKWVTGTLQLGAFQEQSQAYRKRQGRRSRVSRQETYTNAVPSLWVKQTVAESFELAPFSIKRSTRVDVQPGGLPYLEVGSFLVKAVAQSRGTES